MANSVSHASLPYPIKNARYTIFVPFLDADGDPTDPTTPDTEISQDGGAYADAAEEVTTITGSNGSGYITLTGAETNNSVVGVAFKIASGPKATLAALYPRNLPILESGTAGAGAAGSITLASGTYTGLNLTGCFVRTTGGTGGGGTGGANNQARRITAYNTSTRVATVTPNWETTPDATTTYDILLPEGVLVPMLTALPPTTLGRTLAIESDGMAHADVKEVAGTTQTAGDIIGDTNDIQSRLPSALVGGRMDSVLGNAAHGGSAATFTAERIIVASTTTNQPAVSLTGNGAGAGLKSVGGATGHGMEVNGGSSGGDGFHAHADLGNGIEAEAHGANGHGMLLQGDGSGSGLRVIGGATGNGLTALGGTTSGDGINAAPQGTGDDIDADITGNLSGSVGSVTGAVGSVTGAVGSVTGNVGGNVTGSVGSVATGGITAASLASDTITAAKIADDAITAAKIAADAIGSSELAASAVSEIWTTALTESYNTDGAAPTPAQALFVIMQMLTEMSISGTTMTIKKLDGSTTALTLTLDSATTPTSVTRAT